MRVRTPFMLVTGPLGSGKTTLLRRLLEGANLRLAVVMNEFGELAIDSRVIEGQSVRITELVGGCVCCSLTGELEAAVREIIALVAPEMIVLEATGVAEADALVYEVEEGLPEVRVESVVCLVDAYMSVRHPFVGYSSRTQLEVADIIIINKVDLVTEEEVAMVQSQVRQFNEKALMVPAVQCDIDISLLFGPEPARQSALRPHLHGEVQMESFIYRTDRLLDEERFLRVVADLPSEVYRAKGFVRFTQGSRLFNYVVGRADLEEMAAQATELVFIGPHLERAQERILRRLRNCEV